MARSRHGDEEDGWMIKRGFKDGNFRCVSDRVRAENNGGKVCAGYGV